MFLLLSLLPALLTVVLTALAVPFMVARHVAAAEGDMEVEAYEAWDVVLADLEEADVEAGWDALLTVAVECDEWSALLDVCDGTLTLVEWQEGKVRTSQGVWV